MSRVLLSVTWPGSAAACLFVEGVWPQEANKTNAGTAKAKNRI
jgi:hypothetical protein